MIFSHPHLKIIWWRKTRLELTKLKHPQRKKLKQQNIQVCQKIMKQRASFEVKYSKKTGQCHKINDWAHEACVDMLKKLKNDLAIANMYVRGYPLKKILKIKTIPKFDSRQDKEIN